MTYKTAARQMHFKAQEGSDAVRMTQRGYGGIGMVGGDPVEILPSVKEQYEAHKKRVREIDRLLDSKAPGIDRENLRAELADRLRQIGSMRQLLQDGSRMAYEKIFVQVANCRLPKDRFLTITEEARSIWRSEGYADLLPPPSHRQKQKAVKRAFRNRRD